MNFGDSSLNFESVIWVDKTLMTSPGSTNAKYMWAIETELGKRGIEIQFPQRDLYVRSGQLKVLLQNSTA